MTWKRTWKVIGRLVLALLVIHFIILGLFYFFQEKVLFNPRSFPPNYDFKFRLQHEEIFIPTSDGQRIHGVLFQRPQHNRIVLFFHGNGGTVSQWGHQAGVYLELGYDVLFVDYRGYGKSSGHIYSQEMLVDDAELAYDYVREQYPSSAITIAGMSMGTGIATQLAARVPANKLILMAPYSSLSNLIVEKGKVVPRSLIRYPFATDKTIPSITYPVAIMHGTTDRLIPFAHAEALQAIRPDIEIIPIENCGHMVGHCGRGFEVALRQALY